MLCLRFYEPLIPGATKLIELAEVDVSPDITKLDWTSEMPIGWKVLSAGFREPHRPQYGYLAKYVRDVPFAHVECWAGYTMLFEGRLVETLLDEHGVIAVTVEGYGVSALADDVVTSASATLIDSDDIARQVLYVAAPLLRPATGDLFLAPDMQHSLGEFDLMTAAEVFDALMKQGGDETLWDMLVYENRVMRFVPRVTPDAPDYDVPFDESVANVRKDYRKLVSDVVLSYSDATTGEHARVDLANRQWTYGTRRRVALNGGTLSASQALGFASTYLATHATADISTTLTRDGGRDVELYNGGYRAAERVVSGGYVALARDQVLPIVRTSFDANAWKLTADLGSRVRTTRDVIRALTHDRDRRRKALNPLTGSREAA
jgi:hypothetical protein